jgi:hypothetical protein
MAGVGRSHQCQGSRHLLRNHLRGDDPGHLATNSRGLLPATTMTLRGGGSSQAISLIVRPTKDTSARRGDGASCASISRSELGTPAPDPSSTSITDGSTSSTGASSCDRSSATVCGPGYTSAMSSSAPSMLAPDRMPAALGGI